jgi:hypothetical protein
MTDEVDTSQLVGSGPAARQSHPHVDPPRSTRRRPRRPPKAGEAASPAGEEALAATAKAADAGKERAKVAAPPSGRGQGRSSRDRRGRCGL